MKFSFKFQLDSIDMCLRLVYSFYCENCCCFPLFVSGSVQSIKTSVNFCFVSLYSYTESVCMTDSMRAIHFEIYPVELANRFHKRQTSFIPFGSLTNERIHLKILQCIQQEGRYRRLTFWQFKQHKEHMSNEQVTNKLQVTNLTEPLSVKIPMHFMSITILIANQSLILINFE